MFMHLMHPEEDAPTLFVASCDWYEKEGVDDGTGLTRVRLNPNFDACKLVSIQDCIPMNIVLWPVSPLELDGDLFYVIAK